MLVKQYFYFSVLFTLLAAASVAQNSKEGHINFSLLIYKYHNDHLDQRFDSHVWFRDSLVVEEIMQYNFKSVNYDDPVIWTSLKHYLFIDLRKMLVYKYKTFSDTSVLTDIYPVSDSGRQFRDALSYIFLRGIAHYQSREGEDKDTLVDGVRYTRRLYWVKRGTKQHKEIWFRRCDIPNRQFSLSSDSTLTDGCPTVKAVAYTAAGDRISLQDDLLYLSDTLTAEQRKVFDTWERMADCNATVPKLPYISPHPKPIRKYIDLTKKKKK